MIKALLQARRSAVGPRSRDAVPWVLAAALVALALRAPFWSQVAFPDEGGALLVAHQWHGGGPQLYGGLFLDRPPLLVLFWRLADALGGVEPARWLATGGVVLLVLAAAWAGQQVGHRRGARWAALVAAALASTPLLGTQEVDGELLGAPLVMLSCALVLASVGTVRRPAARVACAFGAGAAASAAVLVKQNLVDGLVFGLVLALVAAFTRAWPRGAVIRVLVPGALGAALPVLSAVVWAARYGPGLRVLWYALYGFRADAAAVIAEHDMSAPDSRLRALVVIALVSGLVPLLAAYLWLARHRLREKDPVTVAVLAMLAVEIVGVALGGSYWPHYLIALVPAAALGAGSMPGLLRGRDRAARSGVALVVVSAVVATLVVASPLFTSSRSGEETLIRWLAVARRQGDTAIVTYGHPNIIEASGLTPVGYPYLWSLPLRTEDPGLRRLTATVSGRSAPTWIIESTSFDSWGVDPRGRLASTVAQHYRQVAAVCGLPVFLHDGVGRALPKRPTTC